MDEVKLVVHQIDDGRKLLTQLEKEGFPITAACWVKPYDEDRWSLTIASPVVDQQGTMAGYRRLLDVQRALDADWITDSNIRLIGEGHPLARGVLDFQRRFPGRMSNEVEYPWIGEVSAEKIYVYPLRQVEIPIYGMMFRGEPLRALHFSFEPHSPHAKMTVESEGQLMEYPAKTGIDWLVSAPEGATPVKNERGKIVAFDWELRGRRMRSTASDIWSFANLEINGFRFLREPVLEPVSS